MLIRNFGISSFYNKPAKNDNLSFSANPVRKIGDKTVREFIQDKVTTLRNVDGAGSSDWLETMADAVRSLRDNLGNFHTTDRIWLKEQIYHAGRINEQALSSKKGNLYLAKAAADHNLAMEFLKILGSSIKD